MSFSALLLYVHEELFTVLFDDVCSGVWTTKENQHEETIQRSDLETEADIRRRKFCMLDLVGTGILRYRIDFLNTIIGVR